MEYRDYLPEHVVRPYPEVYVHGRPLFLDFETTNIAKGDAGEASNRIVLAVWKLGWDGPLKYKWGGEYDMADLLEDIEDADFIVAHNAKFELQWLARCGLDLTRVVVYDTMLAEYVIGGNRWQMQHLSLDRCLQRHDLGGKVGVISRMIKAGICPSEIPREWLLRYGLQDVRVLPELMRKQLEQMQGTRLLPVVYNRCLLTPVLADIESYGMQLDPDLIRIKFAEAKAEHDETERELNVVAGGINFGSKKQLGKMLYETLGFAELKVKRGREWVPKRTPGGAYATDGDTILALKATTAQQREFIRLYTQLNGRRQLLSKYLNKFKACVDEDGGLLYASFNQANTRTQRLSSTGKRHSAQFQNFPRVLKPVFRATGSDRRIAEADGAQLEFRAAAHLGRCAAALADIDADVDVHVFTAQTLTNAGQPTSRQDAKPHTFKPLYGGQSGTEAEQTYYRAFREKYPGITSAQNAWIEAALETKEQHTEWGLIYYWPGTKRDRSGYVSNTTSICNYPVQAFATAEIIPASLVAMWHIVKRTGVDIRIVNTIHDSIIADIHESCEHEFHAISRWCLINFAYEFIEELYDIKLICRLGCGVKVGTHWGTGEETKYEAEPALYKEAA